MKSLFFLPLLFVGSLLIAQSACPISESLYNELDVQATQIMLNEMVVNGNAFSRPIEFDSTRRAQYISALFAVRQLENSPDRDRVIDELNIRPFPFVHNKVINLWADPELEWMINLRAGNPSENLILDSMLARYEMAVTNYDDFLILNSHRIELTCSSPLNTPALAGAFKTAMSDLNFSEAQGLVGDGDNIEMVPLAPAGWGVRYSEGSGDCPAGCTSRQYYDFAVVDPACTEFDIQRRGGTSTRQAAINLLAVYPTPFSSEIHLPATLTRYSYELFDAVGRQVKASVREQSGPVTGLGGLVSGWYVLKVRDQKGKVYLARVIK